MADSKHKLIPFFGKDYDYRELGHGVCDAFMMTALALRDLAEIVAAHGLPDDATSEPERVTLGLDTAAYEGLPDRISSAREAVHRVYVKRPLYVAYFGTLVAPRPYFGISNKTRYDRVLEGISNATSEVCTITSEEWSAFDDKARDYAKWFWQRRARHIARSDLIISADMYVTEMWDLARVASRLRALGGREQRILIDGSWIFARLGFLLRASAGDDSGVNGYPTGDELPTKFTDATAEEYAELMSELSELAARDLGIVDKEVVKTLNAARRYAARKPRVAKADPADFSFAYEYLRNALVAEMDKLMPDRRAFWQAAEEADGPQDQQEQPATAVGATNSRTKTGRARRRRRVTTRKLTEKQHLAVQLFAEFKGDKAEAAEKMGVSRATFGEHLKTAQKNSPCSRTKLPQTTEGIERNRSLTTDAGRRRSMPERRKPTVICRDFAGIFVGG